MDLLIALGIFLGCVAGCMAAGLSLAWALLAGFVCFFAAGLRRGNAPRDLMKLAVEGAATAEKVLIIMLLIGLLTALWRAGGTVAFFVRMGIACITPHTFVLVSFLLSAVFSLAFGSCFGVSGTAGVVLMTIARSGGANLLVTAGAIMSGIYFGERMSPASSAVALTAAVCKVDQRDYQNRMWRDTPAPFLIALAVYGALSVAFPIRQVDAQIVAALEEGFVLTWPVALPAVALLILPWLKASAALSIAVSCALSALCALLLQREDAAGLLRACVTGYVPEHARLADIMSGGGLISMVNVVFIVVLSCAYSGMLNGTGMLRPVTDRVSALVERIGLFPAHVVVAVGTCGLFCNQSVSNVMSAQLLEGEYERREIPRLELAANIGNSVISLAGLIPWSISATVPLTALGVGAGALPFACYLYLISVCAWFKAHRRQRVGEMGTFCKH